MTARRPLARVVGDIRGAIAIQIAILLVAIIGFAALGTEMVVLLLTSRQMQSAADAAALAAAAARVMGYPTDYTREAFSVAANAGFINGQNGAVVTVNSPPLGGHYINNPGAIEVVITQPQNLQLVRVLYSGVFNVRARAAALAGGGSCVLSLDATAASAVYASNGADVNLNQCGLNANSTSATALMISGAAEVSTSAVTLVGNYLVTNGGMLNVTGSTNTSAGATADPYASVSTPAAGTCLGGGTITYKTLTLPAGTYCSGIAISNASNVTLNGIYVLKNGSFSVSGGSTVTGTATIVLTGTGSSIGTVSLSNGATVSLTAPSSGATAGMVFFQSRSAPASGTNNFIGGSTVTINGAIYFPNQTVNFSNGASTRANCTQLIARIIKFTGGTTLNMNCTGIGILPIGGQSGLVE